MADRTVVRQGPVVILSLGALLTFAALGANPAADGTSAAPKDKQAPAPPTAKSPGSEKAKTAAPLPPEQRPYKIRAWLSVDPRARVDGRGRETLLAGWKTMVKRFVGAPWDLEIADGDGPLATNALDDVTPEMVAPQAKGFDKAWLFRLEPGPDGLSVAGREFDAATAQVGLLCRRPVPVLGDGPRALLQLSLDVFAASAEIAEAIQGRQRIRIQGAMIPAATPLGQVVSIGSVYRPSRIFYKPDGGILKLDIIKSTYLRVEQIEGGVATCSIVSALPNPLTTNVRGKFKMVAVGLKPASIPTRLRFTLLNPEANIVPGQTPEERPAAGYNVISRPAPDGTPREVGTTDREGRLVLEPNFAEGLVVLRLVAAGTEALAEFPVMPGEMVEERLINHIDPRSSTVTVESELYGLRDEIVDLIAIRHRMEARLKARAEADNWEEVKSLLDEFHTLPPRQQIESRLDALDKRLTEEAQKNPRRRVRTKTAVSLVNDTRGLIDRYLDDEMFEAVENAYKEHTAQAAANVAKTKALPKLPALGMGTNKAAAAGGASGGFSPPGAGFSVAMPGNPTEVTGSTSDGTEVKTYRVVDPSKGAFSVNVWDYPVAVAAGDVERVLNTERDRLLATVPGGKVVKEQAANVSGLPGKEVVIEGLQGKSGEAPTTLARIALANSRVLSVSVSGTKAQISGAPAGEFLNSFRVTARAGQAAAAPASAPAAVGGQTKAAPKAPSPANQSRGQKSF